MKGARSVPRLLMAVALLASTAVAGVVAGAPAASAAACTLCAGGEFHALSSPVRPYAGPRLAIGGPAVQVDVLRLDATGGTPVPTPSSTLGADVQRADVLAVLATVTISTPLNSGTARLWGSALAPGPATMTFKAGQTTSNLVLLQPDASGKVWLRTGTTSSVKRSFNASIDVHGWFSTSTYAGADHGVDSVDDRGLRLRGLPSAVRIASGSATNAVPLAADVRGAAAVASLGVDPASVQAALFSVTVAKPASSTALRIGASDEVGAGAGVGTSRSMTVMAGTTVSSLVVAPVGADGRVSVRVSAASVPVAVDLVGVFTSVAPGDETTAGRVVPLAYPFRALDTSQPAFGSAALGPNQAEDWSFAAFANSVTLNSVAIGGQVGLLGNVITTRLSRQSPTVPVASSLRIYAPGAAQPAATAVNMPEGLQPVTDLALVTYGSNAVARMHNRAGYLHYLLDVYAVVLS